MKIHILGANGMLGRYVCAYFEKQNYKIVRYTRADINLTELVDKGLIQAVGCFAYKEPIKEGDVVINCAGVIKPRVNEVGIEDTIKINSLLPHLLARLCRDIFKATFIHITTDCVFSGKLNVSYNEHEPHDALDVYGKSKSLGEPEIGCTIRTSIIGEEVGSHRSLVEWAKSQKGKAVSGFINHFWNGVTCLQLAKTIEKILIENKVWQGVRHIHSPYFTTKARLIKIINDVYQLNLTINDIQAPEECNRSLESIYTTSKDLQIPELEIQIQEMKDFIL